MYQNTITMVQLTHTTIHVDFGAGAGVGVVAQDIQNGTYN